VWTELANPREFMEHLARKQGAPRDCWVPLAF
jgi:hypothetical protein